MLSSRPRNDRRREISRATGRHRGFPAYDPSDCCHGDAGMNMTEVSMESIDDAYRAVRHPLGPDNDDRAAIIALLLASIGARAEKRAMPQTRVPNIAPIPAVTAIASAPQEVTRNGAFN